MNEQKIKQDQISIGANIKRIRKSQKMKQIELIRKFDLLGIKMTREALGKIERGVQHIYASQLKAFKEVLNTTYDELFK